MPKPISLETSPEHLHFSVDLKAAALRYLSFLAEVETWPELKEAHVLKFSIWRYENLWLPLAAVNSDKVLTAPLDIEWVWFCHMLCPRAYYEDCLNIVHKVVDHKFDPARKKSLKASYDLWFERYPNNCFNVLSEIRSGSITRRLLETYAKCKSKIFYDLTSASLRQSGFCYQVSLPHFRDPTFLGNALLRYKKFLSLTGQKPREFDDPCFDIYLMWQTHMAHPVSCQKDTQTLIRGLLNHRKRSNPNIDSPRHAHVHSNIRNSWWETFGDTLPVCGVMYRGVSPRGRLSQVTSGDVLCVIAHKYLVVINKAKLNGLNPRKSKVTELWIALTKHTKTGKTKHDLHAETIKHRDTFRQRMFGKSFVVDTSSFSHLRFTMAASSNVWKCRKTFPIASALFDFAAVAERCLPNGTIVRENISLTSDITLKLKMTISAVKKGPVVLTLQKLGSFETKQVSNQRGRIWGPVALHTSSSSTDTKCHIANHRLQGEKDELKFTCRVLHSQDLMMSAVQVLVGKTMLVVSHLIGMDQVPLRSQLVKRHVSSAQKFMSLDPSLGERAMLIKNHKGDWGLLIGCWKGFRLAITTEGGGVIRKGKSGNLELRFFKFEGAIQEKVKLEYKSNEYSIKLNKTTINLKTGTVETPNPPTETAENIALAYSIAVLHILCQPMPQNWQPGDDIPAQAYLGQRSPKPASPGDMLLITAAGFDVLTPSNHFISLSHGTRGSCGRFLCRGDEGSRCADEVCIGNSGLYRIDPDEDDEEGGACCCCCMGGPRWKTLR